MGYASESSCFPAYLPTAVRFGSRSGRARRAQQGKSSSPRIQRLAIIARAQHFHGPVYAADGCGRRSVHARSDARASESRHGSTWGIPTPWYLEKVELWSASAAVSSLRSRARELNRLPDRTSLERELLHKSRHDPLVPPLDGARKHLRLCHVARRRRVRDVRRLVVPRFSR